jgi:O-antigen/teichoic acid export membrane protein
VSIRARSILYFTSTAVAAVVSLVTLPLTTKILGPESYGILALGTALAGVGAFVATLGMSFVLASRWREAARDERRRIVGTLFTVGFAIVIAWALVVGVTYAVLHGRVAFLEPLTPAEMALAIGGLLVAPVWAVGTEVVTVEGHAVFYSATAITQALAAPAATLIALFVFDLHTVSLFVGVFTAAVVGAFFGLWYLREYLSLHYDARIRRQLAQGLFALAQIAETAHALVERVLMSRFVGYAALGLFVHSRRYRDFANQATGSVTRGVWPVTLAEARDESSMFPRTGRTWRAVYVWLTACAILATTLGDRFISLLTHGKFTHAWTYLATWFVLLLVSLTAKPELGVLYANARARTMGRVSLLSNCAGIVGAVALIPFIGAWGALAALALQALSFRIAVRIPARRLRRVPFQDAWAVAGCVLLLALYGVKLLAGLSLGVELLLLVVAGTGWLGAAALLARDVFAVLPGGGGLLRLRRAPAA